MRFGGCADVLCAECRVGRVCPNEAWPAWLAQRLFDLRLRTYRPSRTDGGKRDKPKSHFSTIVGQANPSDRRGSATYKSLIADDLHGVADELLALACERLEADGFKARADTMRDEAWGYFEGRGPLLGRWAAERALASSGYQAAIDMCHEVLDGHQCPSGPSRRLLLSDLHRYERLAEEQQRKRQASGSTASALAARSRRLGGRRQTSVFGGDG